MAGMNRRRCLAALGAAGASSLAGCVGEDADVEGEFEIDRAAIEGDGDCAEVELVDEPFLMMSRLFGFAIGGSVLEWRVDMRAGEELGITVYDWGDDPYVSLPRRTVTAPDGETVLDDDSGSNHHAVAAETDGTYTIRLSHRYWAENNRYKVVIRWFESTGCAYIG